MSKAKLNFWLDVVTGLAFAGAAITGVAFLFMGSGGYQGGRNPDFMVAFLGLSRNAWSDMHTVTSLVMMAGVGAHLALHWSWMTCMAKRLLQPRPLAEARATTYR